MTPNSFRASSTEPGPEDGSVNFSDREKIVCTGAKSIDDVYKGLENVFQSLRNIGIDVKGTPEIKVQNIVASADLHSVLNLNAIAIGLGWRI